MATPAAAVDCLPDGRPLAHSSAHKPHKKVRTHYASKPGVRKVSIRKANHSAKIKRRAIAVAKAKAPTVQARLIAVPKIQRQGLMERTDCPAAQTSAPISLMPPEMIASAMPPTAAIVPPGVDAASAGILPSFLSAGAGPVGDQGLEGGGADSPGVGPGVFGPGGGIGGGGGVFAGGDPPLTPPLPPVLPADEGAPPAPLVDPILVPPTDGDGPSPPVFTPPTRDPPPPNPIDPPQPIDPPVVSGVPEPGVWVLMIAGFGLVGVQLRVRKSQIHSF